MDTDSIDALIARLQRNTEQRNRRNSIVRKFLGFPFVLFAVAAFLPGDGARILATLAGCLLFLPIIYTFIDQSSTGIAQYRQSIEAVLDMEDLRLLKPLIASYRNGAFRDKWNQKSQYRLIASLTRLLQRIEPEHASLLDASDQLFLCLRIWNYYSISIPTKEYKQYILAVLTALGKVAEPGGWPERHVRALVKRPPKTEDELHIHEAAQESLRQIQERHRPEEEATSLLRASEDNRSQQLLRPASGDTQHNDANLLQPIELPDDQTLEHRNADQNSLAESRARGTAGGSALLNGNVQAEVTPPQEEPLQLGEQSKS